MVCLGNICRSPLAHGIMEHVVKEKGLNWEVDSAGTGNWHIGEPPDVRSIAIAKKYFLTAALIGSCCFVCSCENTQEEIDRLTKKKVMQEEATGVESYISQDGKMKARLKAPLMLRVMADTQYVEFPRRLHVDFYDDSTRIETWLDCKYGKYFENLNKVYLRDSVVVITLKGDTLRCHTQSLLGSDHFNAFQHLLVIEQGFAHAHVDYVG